MARVLVVRPGGIGDAVHLVPALRLIRHAYPDCEIEILAEKRNAGLFSLCPMVNQVFLYDNWRHLIMLFSRRFDLIIDTEQWHRLSAICVRVLHGSRKVGFSTNNRLRMFTDAVDYHQDVCESANFLKLVDPLGLDDHSIAYPFLEVPGESKNNVNKLLADVQNDFVALSPGASIPQRQWGHDRYAALAAQISRSGLTVVVVGGGGDTYQGEFIASRCRGLNLAGATSLSETAAIIQKARLLISGDTGVLHIAVGLDVPTVSLFGPGRDVKWAPRGSKHIVLNKNLPCSPCTIFGYTPKCPDDARCIQEISVEEVFDAVKRLLGSQGIKLGDEASG